MILVNKLIHIDIIYENTNLKHLPEVKDRLNLSASVGNKGKKTFRVRFCGVIIFG